MNTEYFLPVLVESPRDVRGGLPSCSGLERIALCPGSRRAEAAFPESPGGADAAMGTRLHRDMELGSLSENEEEAEAVIWCREMEARIVQKVFEGRVLRRVLREQRWWSESGRFSGQADVVYFDGHTALVIDYKFGRGEVAPPRRNWQLRGLALLAFEQLGAMAVCVGILQPFAERRVPELLMLSRAEKPQLLRLVEGALDAADNPRAALCPGEAQCRYCRAKATCPALRLTVKTGITLIPRNWQNYSPEVKRQAFDLAKLAASWADAVFGCVERDLDSGREIMGVSRGRGATRFDITDIKKAFAILADAGVTADEFVSCCKPTLGRLDEVFLAARRRDNPKMTVADGKTALRALLAPVGENKKIKGKILTD